MLSRVYFNRAFVKTENELTNANAISRKFEMIVSTAVRLTFINVRKHRTTFAFDDFCSSCENEEHATIFFSIIIFCFILFIYFQIKVVNHSYRRQGICRN